jgi:ferric-dicitrate binding protein FerR (iron transport regulator)
MENLNQEQLDLLVRHFKGATSGFEEKLLDEWIRESEANKEAYEEFRAIWNLPKATLDHVPDMELAWKKVQEKANIGSDAPEVKVRSLFEVKTYLRIAAILVIVLGLGIVVRMMFFGEEKRIVLSSDNERKEFYLPDSSKIWLNKNTRLSYTEDYNEKVREVKLEGEAFFEVRKDKTKPFIVLGKISRTEVLGTSFNIRSIAGISADEIEVMTGKVSFSSTDTKKQTNEILLPGDRAVVSEKGVIEKTKIEDPNSLAWKTNRMTFENTSLEEVVAALENYFNVEVEIQNPELKHCKFSGNFSKSDLELEQMMKVLSVSINFSYSKNNNKYVLTGKGCN